MATLRGLKRAGFSFREMARLLGVSDSTVREAFGGNQRKDRPISDERRELTFARLERIAHERTGNTRPSQIKHAPPPDPVADIEVLAAGSVDHHAKKHALRVGEVDQTDANGALVGKPVRKVVHDRQLAALLSKAVAEFGHGKRWAIAFFGEFTASAGYSANTKSGTHRGWFTRKVEGDPQGNEHPAVRLARDIKEDLDVDIRSIPTGLTPEISRKMSRDIRADYINRYAEAITGQHWVKVHAIWISPAKTY